MRRLTDALAVLAAAALPAALWCQADQVSARDIFYSAADLLDKPHPAEYKAPPVKPAHQPKTGQPTKTNQLQVTVSRLGVRYSILKQNAAHAFDETPPETAFHAGDRVRLSVMANQPGYLYIIEKGSTSEWRALFPDPEINGGKNTVVAGKTLVVPSGPGEAFQIDEHPGQEKIFILLTRTPEPDLDATIVSLRKGEIQAENTEARIRKRIQTRDLVFTRVDDQDDKAVYVVTKENAGQDQRIVSDVVLNHQ